MLLDSHKPISEPCARIVEPAVATILRLGINQEEVVENLSRALGIVKCVLDYRQSIARQKLAELGRTFWTKLTQIPSLPPETVQRIRSIILECVGEIRRLPESNGVLRDNGEPSRTPLFDDALQDDNHPQTLAAVAGDSIPVPQQADAVCDAGSARQPD